MWWWNFFGKFVAQVLMGGLWCWRWRVDVLLEASSVLLALDAASLPPSYPPRLHQGGCSLPTPHPLRPQTLKVEPNEAKERSGSTQEEHSSTWDHTLIKHGRCTLIDGFDRWLMACHHSTINIVVLTKRKLFSHPGFNELCTYRFVSVCFIGVPIKVGGNPLFWQSKPCVGANIIGIFLAW